jgi:hypothetical protein
MLHGSVGSFSSTGNVIPQYMGEGEIRQFLSHLAVDAKISASTQTVALSALLFLYKFKTGIRFRSRGARCYSYDARPSISLRKSETR